MDKIMLKDIQVFGYHGVFEEERKHGQRFFIDIEAFLDLKPAGKADDLEKTVDYAKIYEFVRDINNSNKFRLIERFAYVISQEILSTYKEISRVVVRIRKPDAPIRGDFAWVGVEIENVQNKS